MNRLTALSGFDRKGPAAFLAEIEGRRFLLDLGEGPDDARRPDLSGVGPVDAILVSHGHPDHVGALDMKGALGNPPVHATGLVARTAARGLSGEVLPLPMEGASEIAGVTVETGPAGHAPGAVWMRLGGEEGLLYTGDCSPESVLFAYRCPPRAAALVLDASYGVYDEPLESALARLLALAQEPLLLPAPAGGRGLEMALLLCEAGAEVALCPAHLEVASILLESGGLSPRLAARLCALLEKAAPLGPDAPARGVMIAAKPNAQGGVAAALAERFARSGEARIVFTGHLSAGTPAQALVAAGKAQFLRWNVHPRLTDIAALLEAVRPRLAMPAFVAQGGREALAAALPGFRLADRPRMKW
ncbi:MBL fold metallo-hydrolase [Aureimonas populi]|uniref:MBL fold metallo-hydrolase n=1 Tax=Aureimonas populi TaxID=1701758 RepID=A0ABW5CPE4_9HYPH|nr:MBL fold metallo-hydrolase [Aureimonas populi]